MSPGNYVSFMMGMTFAGFPALNPGERQIPFEVQQSPMVEGLGLLEHSQSNSDESMKQAMICGVAGPKAERFLDHALRLKGDLT